MVYSSVEIQSVDFLITEDEDEPKKLVLRKPSGERITIALSAGIGNMAFYIHDGDDWTAVEEPVIAIGPEAPEFDYNLLVLTDNVPPAEPSNFTASPSNAKVTLRWGPNPDPDLDRYEVRKDLEAWVSAGLASEYAFTGLTNDTEYDFKIRAIDLSGNISTVANVSATPANGVIVQSVLASDNGAEIVAELDTDPVAGNVIIAFFGLSDDRATIVPPGSGWETIDTVNTSDDSTSMKAYWRPVNVDDPASYVFQKSGADVDLDLVLVEVSGVDVLDPIHSLNVDKVNSTNTTLTIDPLVTTLPSLRCLFIWRTAHDTPVYADPPSGLTTLENAGRVILGTKVQIAAGNASSTATWTNTSMVVGFAVALV